MMKSVISELKFVGVPHLISSGIFEYGGESLRYLVYSHFRKN